MDKATPRKTIKLPHWFSFGGSEFGKSECIDCYRFSHEKHWLVVCENGIEVYIAAKYLQIVGVK